MANGDPSTTLYLIRHGRVHNPHQIYYGRLPRFRLAQEGRDQVQATADLLADRALTAVYSSPLLRARQSAAIIARRAGVPLHSNKKLIEVHSVFDGETQAAMEARNWDFYSTAPPGYEQPADIMTRMRRFFRFAARHHPNQALAAVSHGDIIALTILYARAEPLLPSRRRFTGRLPGAPGYPGLASVTTLRLGPDGEILRLEPM